jgi:AcrR family transcriptional regulator
MNRSESKYFNTAVRMDQAFLDLLDQKDFAYITVKEICEKAGVNRSTFYLHYETVNDLLTESIAHMNQQFLSYMSMDSDGMIAKISTCPKEQLYLIAPKYLAPYLSWIAEHRKLFKTALAQPECLHLDDTYAKMFQHVFVPILMRFNIPEQQRSYMMSFYINGLMGIISAWLKKDCQDSIDSLTSVIERCIMTEEDH